MPSHAVPSATVILLRNGRGSPEVLLLERHAQSHDFPNLSVFPGGLVEEDDHALLDHLAGVSVAEARQAFPHLDPEHTLGFFVAAIRETFEEAGILLARRRGETRPMDGALASALARHRLDVQSGQQPFRKIIESEALELAGDSLVAHAHWITPELSPRRFSTLFFTAITPPGQLAQHDGVEASDHVWIRPADALQQRQAGERQIMFPTACNLETLVDFKTAEEALAASRRRLVVPVLPYVVEENGEKRFVIPTEAGYAASDDLATRTAGKSTGDPELD